ncbi:MAG: hypothetical protein IGS54_01360 [Elainella sp. C42_A2020_010]|nr:hypothetical protein [Elainella sp. C42_A2020_010]
MNSAIEELLLELQHLPEAKIQAILEFTRFLAWKSQREGSAKPDEPLLSVAGILSSEPLTAEEIESALYG